MARASVSHFVVSTCELPAALRVSRLYFARRLFSEVP